MASIYDTTPVTDVAVSEGRKIVGTGKTDERPSKPCLEISQVLLTPDATLRVLRHAYLMASATRQQIDSDLLALRIIGKSVADGVFEPSAALDRAAELGLIAWPDDDGGRNE